MCKSEYRQAAVLLALSPTYTQTAHMQGVVYMYTDLEQRAMDMAVYIIDNKTTVRQAAKQYGVSKSTVHTEHTIMNASCGQ